MKEVRIYTDGACRGNPGIGGWGAILMIDEHKRELCGGEKETTNNRMEMMAAIEGLTALTQPCHVSLTTDSKYVLKGMTEWINNWRKNGFKTAQKKPVKNADLWERLDELCSKHDVDWHWVKGHAGHEMNERADFLANKGADQVS